MYQTYLKYNAQTPLKSTQDCSPLLCYRFVSTALTAQIPNGNAIANLLGLLHTEKERDSETGFSYFGARYYDSDLMTGWLSVDPMADKYPSLSPYAYCANNPVKLVDPDGEELVFTGESEYVNSLLKIMNSCFSFSSDVFSIVDGKVQSRELNSEELSLMSEKQQAFYNTIMSAVNDEKTISIGIVNNSKDVLFGSWNLNAIDVADMQTLGNEEGFDMYAVIGHEIAEQQYKQTSSSPSYPIGHYKYGLKAEEKISGYFRTSEYGALKCITVNSSNYKEGYHIQVNIHSNLNDEIESVIRIKKHINFGR